MFSSVHCGINIAATVDIEKVTAFATTLPHVAAARNYQYMCSDPGQDLIKNDIRNNGVDRVVVAACSPRMHEPTYRKAVHSAGLNPYFFEMSNIQEQCSWVHASREDATKKAMDLIAAAVAKVSLHEALDEKEVRVTPSVLVIGGGIAGIQASLDIAHSGFEVYLVEKSPTWEAISGNSIEPSPIWRRRPPFCLRNLKKSKPPFIHVLTQSEAEEVEGFVGNFKVRVRENPRDINPEKCTRCQKCEAVCPVRVPSQFNMGLTKSRPSISPPLLRYPSPTPLIQKTVSFSRKENAASVDRFAQRSGRVRTGRS